MYGRENISEQSNRAAPPPPESDSESTIRQTLLLSISQLEAMFTKPRIVAVAAILLAISVIIFALQVSRIEDNILPGGSPIGGDYVAFYGAASGAVSGEAAEMYDSARFEAQLLEVGPPRSSYKMTWQYPPTYFLLIAPLAFLPFIAGWIVWSLGSATAFWAVMRNLGARQTSLLILIAAPSTLHAFVTGQNGFLTAILLSIAAINGKNKPIIAGLAAALLTMKPQLGLLLPVVWIAAGYWRAFGVATLGSVAFAGLATYVFGTESWIAFFDAALGASDKVGAGIMPLYKMVTPFAFINHLTGISWLAAAFHIVIALIATILIARYWRCAEDREIMAASLCAGVFLVAPYAFYYELIVLAVPIFLVVKRAMASGWLAYEKLTIAIAVLLPMTLPGAPTTQGLSTGFICVSLVAWIVYRRMKISKSPT